MNRRRFLGTLLGLAAAPVVAARVLSEYKPTPKYKIYNGGGSGLAGFKGSQFIETGYVDAPYISMRISSVPIVAKKRKLEGTWTCE